MKAMGLSVMLVGLGLCLAGCAGGGGGKHLPTTSVSVTTTRSYRQRSTGSPLVVGIGQKAVAGINLLKGARILSPTRLALVTAGSTGCPATPKRLIVESPDVIRIDVGFVVPKNTPCIMDYGTTPFIISINPNQIDVYKQLMIRLYYYDSKKPLVRVAPPI